MGPQNDMSEMDIPRGSELADELWRGRNCVAAVRELAGYTSIKITPSKTNTKKTRGCFSVQIRYS